MFCINYKIQRKSCFPQVLQYKTQTAHCFAKSSHVHFSAFSATFNKLTSTNSVDEDCDVWFKAAEKQVRFRVNHQTTPFPFSGCSELLVKISSMTV